MSCVGGGVVGVVVTGTVVGGAVVDGEGQSLTVTF